MPVVSSGYARQELVIDEVGGKVMLEIKGVQRDRVVLIGLGKKLSASDSTTIFL